MPVQKRKPTKRELQAEMVIEIDLLHHLLVRCHQCGDFKLQSQAAERGCSVCNFVVSYCHDCGGADAANKGVLAHQRWFATVGPRYDFGSAHTKVWKDYQEEKEKRRNLKLVKTPITRPVALRAA